MADAAKEVAPQGEVKLEGADKAAHEASVKASDEHKATVEKVGAVLLENGATGGVSDVQVKAGSEAFVAAAEKQAEAGVKFTKEGYVIGVDGKNPVSNENPDPRTVRGTTR